MRKKVISLALIGALLFGLCACDVNTPGFSGETQPTLGGGADISQSSGELFTDRDLNPEYEATATITLSDEGCTGGGTGVTIADSTVTITQSGTYRLTGKLTNGQIRVEAADTDKVQLVLDNLSVSNQNSAALYVLCADKVFVTTVEGTQNALATEGEYLQTDENTVDGAVFAKSDITFNGTGYLTVISPQGHGVVTKDDLKITGGDLRVIALRQGLSGKDSVRVAGGSITVESGTDAIHSENTEDTTRGYVYITEGTFDLQAGADGISASGELVIENGTFSIQTGEGSDSVTHSQDGWGGGWGGDWGGSTSTDTPSCKGIKSGGAMTLSGGSFTMNTEDDAIHCGGSLLLSGGEYTISTGDDGIHSDADVNITDGTIIILKSYEGLEGNYITVAGGNMDITSSDDGLNAAGGNDGSGMMGPWGGGGGFGEATDAYILISGGCMVLNASGDGIDSNGNLTVTGGEVYLCGPTNSGNGALDYAGTGKITGGIFIALGSAGMAMNFGTTSTQGAILCSLNGNAGAGVEVRVSDQDGNVLASYTAVKTFQSVLVSAPGMVQGGTYTVTVGTASAEFTLTSIIYGSGMGGGPGGGGGGRPGRP